MEEVVYAQTKSGRWREEPQRGAPEHSGRERAPAHHERERGTRVAPDILVPRVTRHHHQERESAHAHRERERERAQTVPWVASRDASGSVAPPSDATLHRHRHGGGDSDGKGRSRDAGDKPRRDGGKPRRAHTEVASLVFRDRPESPARKRDEGEGAACAGCGKNVARNDGDGDDASEGEDEDNSQGSEPPALEGKRPSKKDDCPSKKKDRCPRPKPPCPRPRPCCGPACCVSCKPGVLVETVARPLSYAAPGDDKLPLTVEDAKRIAYVGTASEVFLAAAVNPVIAVRGRHVVVAWDQQRINNGGAVYLVVACSHDGGKLWRRSPLQFPASLVIGRVVQLGLAYSSDGALLYLVVEYFNPNLAIENGYNQGGIAGFVSTNDGCDWCKVSDAPSWCFQRVTTTANIGFEIPPDFPPNYPLSTSAPTRPSVAADRCQPTVAYVGWQEYPSIEGHHSDAWFAETRDGGKCWKATIAYNAVNDPALLLLSPGLENESVEINSVIPVQQRILPRCERKGRGCGPKGKCGGHCGSSSSSSSGSAEVGGGSSGGGGCKDKKCGSCSQCAVNAIQLAMTRIYAAPGSTVEEFKTDTIANDNFAATRVDAALVFRRTGAAGTRWDQQAVQMIASIPAAQVATGGYTYTAGVPTGYVGHLLRTGNGGGANGHSSVSVAVSVRTGLTYAVAPGADAANAFYQYIQLVSSSNGGHTWSAPMRVNQTPQTSLPSSQAFTPIVAVTPDGLVGILYSDLRNNTAPVLGFAAADTWLAVFQEVRVAKFAPVTLRFIREYRLSKVSWNAEAGPQVLGPINLLDPSQPNSMNTGDIQGLVASGVGQFAVAYTMPLPDTPAVPVIVYQDGPTIVYTSTGNRQRVYFAAITVEPELADTETLEDGVLDQDAAYTDYRAALCCKTSRCGTKASAPSLSASAPASASASV